jgi:hypothetical protein
MSTVGSNADMVRFGQGALLAASSCISPLYERPEWPRYISLMEPWSMRTRCSA